MGSLGTRKKNYYNPERKEAFLDQKFPDVNAKNEGDTNEEGLGNETVAVVSDKRRRTIFFLKKVSVFENRFQKDLSDFSDEEYEIMFIEWIRGTLTFQFQMTFSRIRTYMEWCLTEGYISPRKYQDTLNCLGILESAGSLKGEELSKIALADKIDQSSVDFVFESEDEFFKYITSIFQEGRYTMLAALCTLLYYQFTPEEAVELKKTDVDEENREVAGRKIDNDDAWEIILSAKNLRYYISMKDQREMISNSEYLLRNTARNTNGQMSVNTARALKKYEDEAAEFLPDNSPYKNIRVYSKTMRKLKPFYDIMEKEKDLDPKSMRKRFERGDYDDEGLSYAIYKNYLRRKSSI